VINFTYTSIVKWKAKKKKKEETEEKEEEGSDPMIRIGWSPRRIDPLKSFTPRRELMVLIASRYILSSAKAKHSPRRRREVNETLF
jgi:hypothetical protein